ncbi:MAG: dihydrofolate reductase family protein [Bacteroidota bacterium]|nr:dihydrofolate reductase family protein [Bacteroidota bacterium]
MRKLIFLLSISADGYVEGPNNEIDWHNVDDEFNDFMLGLLSEVDAIIFGRKTYELLSSYWTTTKAMKDSYAVAERLNNLDKIVFSTTLENVYWNNSKLIKANVEEEIRKLKGLPGKYMTIGGPNLVSSLLDYDLVDEFWLIINPVFLGKGNKLFNDLKDRISLNLDGIKTFTSGNVLLRYSVNKKI